MWPISISELALRPRDPRLLRLLAVAPFFRISLLRFMTGVSLIGSVTLSASAFGGGGGATGVASARDSSLGGAPLAWVSFGCLRVFRRAVRLGATSGASSGSALAFRRLPDRLLGSAASSSTVVRVADFFVRGAGLGGSSSIAGAFFGRLDARANVKSPSCSSYCATREVSLSRPMDKGPRACASEHAPRRAKQG